MAFLDRFKIKPKKEFEPEDHIMEKPNFTKDDLGFPDKRFKPEEFKEPENQEVLEKLKEIKKNLEEINTRLKIIEKIAKEE